MDSRCSGYMGTIWVTCVYIQVRMGWPTYDPNEFYMLFPYGYHVEYMGAHMGACGLTMKDPFDY